MSNGALAGKTAQVTGSSRNIGRATALALAADGANIVVNGVQDEDAAQAVAKEVEDTGAKALVHLADVSDEAACGGLIASLPPGTRGSCSPGRITACRSLRRRWTSFN